ncbi:hypothetical protein GZ77_19545 [Endozoicomonas montiporae]|uniref:DUF4124 domain-containing protein n=2 Tax=Endozoicomonas montiporae TaxID=1027273 RepID=A0A081N2K9_9GAMM|nr:DUF4124 domain-containing protein [Endozoicomonas montiporae]AMO54808.1 hypothetical protein EZMO1_0561 [Endozoicomonas montiporae CL-33]KEQ12682.1 hypothetical protein GZ77_19545 [Endozoicomonas montiporae]
MKRLIKSYLTLLPLAFLAIVLTETVTAEKVFIWKDDRGVTHYSDRPGPDGMETEYILSDEDPENDQISLTDESSAVTEDGSSVDSTTEPLKDSNDQPVSAPDPGAAETLAFCNKLNANLLALEARGRIRLTHDDGREDILDDAGKSKEKQRLKELMNQFCK